MGALLPDRLTAGRQTLNLKIGVRIPVREHVETIDKLAWVHLQDRKALFVRSKGKDVFYNPGGKREAGESDQQALVREIKEELKVDLLPDSIVYLDTFAAQAHGKPAGTKVEIKCYSADFEGELKPGAEIEELAWLDSTDTDKTSATGQLTLSWLKEQDKVD